MKGSVVVVEGKNDAIALKNIGFSGKIIEFHKFGGVANFADSVARYEKLIILFDRDRKGSSLQEKQFSFWNVESKLIFLLRENLQQSPRER